MMYQMKTFRYIEEKTFQALELPYSGDDLAMTVFLPKKTDGLMDFEKSLTPEKLSTLLSRLTSKSWFSLFSSEKEVSVFLPKFKAATSIQLSGVLDSMGMTDAFSPEKADFSGISKEKGFCISEVVHKAFVEVDEEGTEAAAATAGVMPGAARIKKAKPIPVFRADHPFVFLIRAVRSGSILFLGRLVDPRND